MSLRNLSFVYQPEKQFTDLPAIVYHTSDSISLFFVHVNYGNLLYKKDPYSGIYICSYRLSYKLTGGYDAAEIFEESSLYASDSINYGRNAGVVHSLEFRAIYPGKYLLEVTLTDINRQDNFTRFVSVDKSTMHGRQNFLAIDSDRQPLFNDYLGDDQPFRIIVDEPAIHFLHVNYYNRKFPVARPPYAEDREPAFQYKPDSVFIVPLFNGESEWLELPDHGFYHFREDTSLREGFTIFRFPDSYPELTVATQLRGPLRYITSRKEFDSLMISSNVKAAVDEFWLKTAKTPERAMVLLQKYYQQVEEANRYFHSYQEGWKTDRGLIYVVFGKPTYVYRGDGIEEWVYGEPQNRNSLRFTFIRVINPFTDNDYMLLRSPTFKDPWFITVQSWRR
ncbi:MAG: GWxTD domain-containing protein [Bacteroidales bacterium]|nr:GWxTD domain-containing protein [Bacteroidales bacterium]